MKREEKNALSRQRILDAAVREFSVKGYQGASLNTVCAGNNISKGNIYHYFKDKDELYLMCVSECFEKLTEYLAQERANHTGNVRERLQRYFDRRLGFFAKNPLYLGIFADAALQPGGHLTEKIAAARRDFDELSIQLLTELLESTVLREGIIVSEVEEDFRMYMDYFNMRFQSVLAGNHSPEKALCMHEERCHRQLDILLYGVVGERE